MNAEETIEQARRELAAWRAFEQAVKAAGGIVLPGREREAVEVWHPATGFSTSDAIRPVGYKPEL